MKSCCGITIWLGVCCIMMLVMVLLGGVTRLTHSGLSITEWRPITGILLPMSDKAWQEEKRKYEGTPEYQYTNGGMSLESFKKLYLIEYTHRLCGRITGVVFLVPWLYFLIKRRISKNIVTKCAVALLFGILQGVVGWFMVQSGMVDVPYVSHYRLAGHLLLAVMIFYLLWVSFLDSMKVPTHHEVRLGCYSLLCVLLIFVVLQMGLGALMAGLSAGLICNTFPLMDGEIVPRYLLSMDVWRQNFLDNELAVQFLHRGVAVIIVLLASAVTLLVRHKSTALMSACIVLQLFLGGATLVRSVPISLASMHQLMGFVVFATVVYVLHCVKVVQE